jgi:hypothetical protein
MPEQDQRHPRSLASYSKAGSLTTTGKYTTWITVAVYTAENSDVPLMAPVAVAVRL